MGNEVAARAGTQGLSLKVPAHIAARIKAAGGGNIPDRVTTNSLTYPGKAWTMSVNGETKVLQRKNEDGDLENVQQVRLVVLDWSQHRERRYYEGVWVEGQGRTPDCWSADGKKPHVSVAAPKHGSCETCPMAAKGSKIGPDGSEQIACGQWRALVVVPANNLDFPALRMSLSVTSDWDKKDEKAIAAGWMAWSQYKDHLRSNGLDHTGAIVTKVRFGEANYPKLQFAPGDFLDEAQFEKVLARAKSEEVQKLLAGFNPPAPQAPKGKPLPEDDEESEGVREERLRAEEREEERQKAIARAERAQRDAEELAAEQAAQEKKEKAAARAKAKAEADAKAKAEAEEAARKKAAEEADADWDEPASPPKQGEIIPPKPSSDKPPARAAKPKAEEPAPPLAPVEVPAGLADLLGAWE